MGRKCGISVCQSDSGREEDRGVTFHKIPMHPDIRPKWMSLCRIPDDKKLMKVIYVCSRHFLKADFCHFKGKKYMLRQGVLPSVFPWNKQKTEMKASRSVYDYEENQGLITNIEIKQELDDEEEEDIKPEIKIEVQETDFNTSTSSMAIKTELGLDNIKEEVLIPTQSTTIEQKVKTIDTPTGPLTFAPNTRIEALDFNQAWCPAKIVEVDYQENEVLVHFEKYSSKYDEWISMNSSTLRAFRTNFKKASSNDVYAVGERCLASWSDARKFPATVAKVIDKDTYEVHFDDGFVKILKSHRMAKATLDRPHYTPLFEPPTGTKQERRDRKRKINVAALFGKKLKAGGGVEDKTVSQIAENAANILPGEPERWTPRWENGRPIGEESVIETSDGPRKSVIVDDPRLPPHWVKHLIQRTHGVSAGKWDSVIVNPDGRRFRMRTEIKNYVEEHPELNLNENMFDFSIYRKSRRSAAPDVNKKQVTETPPQETPHTNQSVVDEEVLPENPNSLKIPVVDNSYKCPIEGCGKNFRRENLAQMHVKHYHPEYTKFLDSTPNVADLAYARTVGESLDRSPGTDKSTKVGLLRQVQRSSTPKLQTIKSPTLSMAEAEQKQAQCITKAKDSEIIKLLSTKPLDGTKEKVRGSSPVLPSGLPSNMYPDIKLKDLLIKSEAIPKRDDINLKTLSASTQRPTGIKTLLPVFRQEPKVEDHEQETLMKTTPIHKLMQNKQQLKRKRCISDNAPDQTDKPVNFPTSTESVMTPAENPSNNVIIEGGEVIKIVQMKREEIINCTCGITEEDGLMIQCELCLCWQHAYCNNIERESQVPDKYICYICQNPIRQRSSKKFFHDQDWLKQGNLPVGNYHCKDEQALKEKFEKLQKSHDLTGGLLELKDYIHTLKVKINIAEAKNHPKLYLWSKPWAKLPLPEKFDEENDTETESTKYDSDHPYGKCDEPSESMLLSLLKTGKEEQKSKDDLTQFPKLDLNTLIGNNLENLSSVGATPIIPQPEAAIDTADCRLNLLKHIHHSQSLVEERLNQFEEQINKIDNLLETEENVENFPKLRQTAQMLMRDLNVLKEFSQRNSF